MKRRISTLSGVVLLVLAMAAPAFAASGGSIAVTTDGGGATPSTWTGASYGVSEAYSCETEGTTYAGTTGAGGEWTVVHTYSAASVFTIICTSVSEPEPLVMSHLFGGGLALGMTDAVGAMASEAWPIALALFTALIGITLGVAIFRYILGRGKGLVKGR